MEKDIKDKNYNLKSEAVETLAGADREEVPVYSQEELNRYRTPKGFHIPQWVKILLIKAWFAGAVCYFILWGLGMYVGNMLDMLFVLGVAMGLVTDLLLNNVIRFLREREVVHYQRFGDALRIAQDALDSKNFYAFNPSFDVKNFKPRVK